jgi:hypothetical protein
MEPYHMHMRFRFAAPIAVFLTLPALAGCESTPKERLQGTWVGERVDNFQPQQAARADGWARGMSFEFKGSRVTVSVPAESPRVGTYKITEATEDQMLVSFLRPHGASDEVTLRLEGEDKMRWMVGDGRSVLLRRAE